MTQVNLSMSISADGFVAGPNQNEDNPLGEGGRLCTPGTSATRPSTPSTSRWRTR